MSSAYRWNQAQNAAGYDAAGIYIHPHYRALQEAILAALPAEREGRLLLVDAGGGSGRLAALFLERFPQAEAIVVDQSEAFLELARDRLRPFGERGQVIQGRLQEADWLAALPRPVDAFVSMSAIHHLSPDEKQTLYRRMYEALAPGGLLLNGDEVRPVDDAEYLSALQAWSDHMRRMQASGHIPPEMAEILDGWRRKNIEAFGQPKQSGDDWHETADVQLGYLRSAGFTKVGVVWQEEMWALLAARKGAG